MIPLIMRVRYRFISPLSNRTFFEKSCRIDFFQLEQYIRGEGSDSEFRRTREIAHRQMDRRRR